VAALSYFALSCSTLAALAYFSEQTVRELTGYSVSWWLWAFASIVLVCWLSYRRITLAAKVLAVALLAEIAIILLLDLKIVFDVGPHGFDVANFAPHYVFAPGLGITAIYAFNSMIGIEGTAIYQEEAIDRTVTIPRATYLALALVGLFYVFTAWCLTSSVGSSQVAAVAHSDPGTFILNRAIAHMGRPGGAAVSLLVLTSSFAAVLALFNNAARYLYALARDGVLPRALAKTHPLHHSPHVAGLVLSVCLVIVFVIAVVTRLDPLVNVSTALVGVGSVGLMALLGITSCAIPLYFARRGIFKWGNTLAPAVGGVLILTATALAFMNYAALTGVNSAVINHLPYVLIVLFAFGVMQAIWLQRRRPQQYLRIGATRVEG
jgi:amino acid transporter